MPSLTAVIYLNSFQIVHPFFFKKNRIVSIIRYNFFMIGTFLIKSCTMKKHLPQYSMIVFAAVLLNSCTVQNNISKVYQEENTAILPANANKATETYVVLNDGTINRYQSLKLVTGVFTSPHLLADGHIKIATQSVKAYQTDAGYAVSQTIIPNARKSYVAVDALPGFAIRVVQGKINVYAKKFYNGRAAVDEFYIQAGEQGEIVKYNVDRFRQMLADNNQALQYFNNLKEKDLFKKLQVTASIYNQDQYMSKN